MMRKYALNQFETYMHPADADRKLLFKGPNGAWVYEDGKPAIDKATGQPLKRALKNVRVPVMSADDVEKASPLIGRLLKTPTYQAVIQDLTKASVTATSGIVNFIIGNETELADAILKAAFPPGSGIVYKGADGYKIDASNWKNPEVAQNRFVNILKGNPKAYSEDDVTRYRKLLTSKNPEEQNLLSLLMANLERTARPAVGGPAVPGGGVPMTPGAPARPGAPAGQNQIDMILETIKTLNKGIDIAKTKLDQTDRWEEPKDYKLWQQIIEKSYDAIRDAQARLPKHADIWGQPEYDGTGFMDFQSSNPQMLSWLRNLYDTGPLYKLILSHSTAAQQRQAPGGRAAAPAEADLPDDQKLAAYNLNKQQIEGVLSKMGKYAPKDFLPEIENFKKFIGTRCDWRQVETSEQLRGVIRDRTQKFVEALKERDKILIFHNVDDSAMVAPSQQALAFRMGSIWSNEFTTVQRRERRAMVLVSRKPITFDFDGVGRVDLTEHSVGDAESMVIMEHYTDKVWKRNFELSGKDPSNVMIGSGDIKKLALILQDRTFKDASHFIEKTSKELASTNPDKIDGKELLKIATNLINAEQRNNRSGDTGRALFHSKVRMTMEQFIRDEESDWGAFVNDTNSKAEIFSDYETYSTTLRSELDKAKKEGDTDKMEESMRGIEKAENESLQTMQSIPHFMILYGGAGCGKSAYPEVFAKKMGFEIFDANFGQARGGIVGQTETWSRDLMDSMLKMANAVIRLDEMDGQFVAEGQQGKEGSWNQQVISDFLALIQNNMATFINRNVFIIGTTNNPHLLRKALVDRAELHLVPMPWNKKGYRKFLDQCVEISKADLPIGPISDPSNPNEYSKEHFWGSTQRLLDSMGDEGKDLVADALVGKGMNFRKLTQWLIQAYSYQKKYSLSRAMVNLFQGNREEFKKRFKSYWRQDGDQTVWLKTPKIEGVPFTPANLAKAAKYTVIRNAQGQVIDPSELTGDDEEQRGLIYDWGFPKVEKELWNQDRAGELPLEYAAPQEQAIGSEVGDETFASTDYYYRHLVSAGIVKNDKVARRRSKNVSFRQRYKVGVVPFFGKSIAMVPIMLTLKEEE
jgi:hypothetical protein